MLVSAKIISCFICFLKRKSSQSLLCVKWKCEDIIAVIFPPLVIVKVGRHWCSLFIEQCSCSRFGRTGKYEKSPKYNFHFLMQNLCATFYHFAIFHSALHWWVVCDNKDQKSRISSTTPASLFRNMKSSLCEMYTNINMLRSPHDMKSLYHALGEGQWRR